MTKGIGEKMKKSEVEVAILLDDGTWYTTVVKVPDFLQEKESQDEFIEWLYDGKNHENTSLIWESSDEIVAVFVMSWRSDLVAQDHPALSEEG
jgi:hypothetical protein